MKKDIANKCGKSRGCSLTKYVLPFSGTKTSFTKFVEDCTKEEKEIKIKEFSKI